MTSGIDILRHIFCLAVIMQHMYSSSRYSPETLAWLADLVNFVDGAVVGFFLISGFLFKPQDALFDFAKRQAIRLLVPYFLFSVGYAVLLAAIGKGNLLGGLLATIQFRGGAGMQLYFLPFLLTITVFYSILEKYVVRRSPAALYILFAFGLFFSVVMPVSTSTGSDERLAPFYFSAFLTGRLLFDGLQRGWKLLLSASLFLTVVGLTIIDHRFLDFAGVLTLFYLASFAPLGPLGVRLPGSGGIYLLHTPILNFAVATLFIKLGIAERANIVVSAFATYGLCLIMTLIIIKLCPRFKWVLLE